MAEIATAAKFLRIPVVGELDHGRLLIPRGVPVFGCREEDQRIAALFVVHSADFLQAELVAIEIQRLVDVANADHCVQIAH